MLRVLLGSLVSAVVLFMWGFCFWMLSPVPKMMVKSVPNEAGLAGALKAYIPEDGHYFVPFGCEVMRSGDEEAKKEFQKRFEDGPVANIIFRTKGDGNMPGSASMFVSNHSCRSERALRSASQASVRCGASNRVRIGASSSQSRL